VVALDKDLRTGRAEQACHFGRRINEVGAAGNEDPVPAQVSERVAEHVRNAARELRPVRRILTGVGHSKFEASVFRSPLND